MAITRNWPRKSVAITGEVNLDTRSPDSSAEEMRESGRSFLSRVVLEKKYNL